MKKLLLVIALLLLPLIMPSPAQAADDAYLSNISYEELQLGINCGGEVYIAANGDEYIADQEYSVSNGAGYVDGYSSFVSSPILGTEDQTLYQSERWGVSEYKLDLPNGFYDVKLQFAETCFNDEQGRVFSVWLEGKKLISDLDIYEEAGANSNYALDYTFTIEVKDNQLNIQAQATVDEPKFSAISVKHLITPPPTQAVASSIEGPGLEADKTIDRDLTTRWASESTDNEWIYFDFGYPKFFNTVILGWEAAYGKSYEIQISDDAVNWTTIYTEAESDGFIDRIYVGTQTARYLRIYGTERAITWAGYSLWEVEVVYKIRYTATASLAEVPGFEADKAIDGDFETRWSTEFSDPQWIYIDLDQPKEINKVALYWETAYGKSYQIQTSSDSANWTDVYSTTNSDGGIDEIAFDTVTTRYIRMYGTERGTGWGYSLWEFEVTYQGPLAVTATASSIENLFYTADKAIDNSVFTRWASEISDPQWVYIDFAAPKTFNTVKLIWEFAYGKVYEIQISDDAADWTTIHTEANSDGNIDIINVGIQTARYLRMYGTERALDWGGYSLWEFEADIIPPQIEITSHSDGQILSVSPITVSGTIDNNDATVIVNGIIATVFDGIFTAENISLSVGQNEIVVEATDLSGSSSASITVILEEPEPIPAAVDINPNTINKKSKGKYVTCYIWLPVEYDVGDIDIATVTINNASDESVLTEETPTEVGDFNSDGITDLMVKFDRNSVYGILSVGSVEVTVKGFFVDGLSFEGSEVVNVMDKGSEHTSEEDTSSIEY